METITLRNKEEKKVIIKILDRIEEIKRDTGYGKVHILIQEKEVKNIESSKTEKIEKPAIKQEKIYS